MLPDNSQCSEAMCGKELDCFGDHAVTCFTGPYMQARHSRVNHALAQAGRDAGYASLLEQVVPELALRKRGVDGHLVLEDAFQLVECVFNIVFYSLLDFIHQNVDDGILYGSTNVIPVLFNKIRICCNLFLVEI